jgi:AraC family ethanolamine operon transcriptional activator
MTQLHVDKLRVDGIEDIRRILDGPSTSCVPLGSGVPHGTLLHASLGDLVLRAGDLSLDVRTKAAFDLPGRIVLDMKLESPAQLFSFRSGRECLAGDVYVLAPGDICDYRATGQLSYAILSLSIERLIHQGGDDLLPGDAEFWVRRRWFRAPGATRALIARSVQRVVHEMARTEHAVGGAALEQLQAELTEAFLWGIMLHEHNAHERHGSSGAAIVRRVDDWVDGQSPETIHIGDLCRALHLSRRTLQRAFTETLGIGPARYLTHRRLIAVRAELRCSDPQTVRVTDTATKYGFWQLGRFARDYRQMFGERPSETLSRAGARSAGTAFYP